MVRWQKPGMKVLLCATVAMLAAMVGDGGASGSPGPTLKFRVLANTGYKMDAIVWTGRRFLYVENTANTDARLLVVGLSDRWRAEGIGMARLGVALGAQVPTLFARHGLRPSGVAPNETMTRFTWTLGSDRVPPRDA